MVTMVMMVKIVVAGTEKHSVAKVLYCSRMDQSRSVPASLAW